MQKILDVGCGVGTLGLSLAARCPKSEVILTDRDHLAVSITSHNAALNDLENTSTHQRLLTEGPHRAAYDLILSNFPAKAGDPVLQHYIRSSADLLNNKGRGAIVIIQALADRCREIIEGQGLRILYADETKQHSIFHYGALDRRTKESTETDLLLPYIRRSGDFRIGKLRYRLQTVWNISDFDQPSWRIEVLAQLLQKNRRAGTMLFWSPGQGHFPCMQSFHPFADKVILAGRDRLALLISRFNLERMGFPNPIVIISADEAADLAEMPFAGSVDFLLTDLDPIPRSKWTNRLMSAASNIVVNGGEWAVVGRSAQVAELMKRGRGWVIQSDRRNNRWRGLILKKNR